jgi:uncharacterized protein (TIGR02117 family)
VKRVARRAVWFLAPPLLYVAAALVLALVPVNAAFRMAADGVRVYLRSNGVHADLVLPTRTAWHDFAAEFPPQHTAALRDALPWVAFGWGDRDFMIETPTWRDLRFATAANALLGRGRGAMHVEYVEAPERYRVYGLRVDPAQYERLVARVRAGFERDVDGRPRHIARPGFGANDAFYASTVDWTVVLTCNEWVRRVLAESGVRTAAWAPFAPALVWHVERAARSADAGRAGQP